MQRTFQAEQARHKENYSSIGQSLFYRSLPMYEEECCLQWKRYAGCVQKLIKNTSLTNWSVNFHQGLRVSFCLSEWVSGCGRAS